MYSFPKSDQFFVDRLLTIFTAILRQERPNSRELNPVIERLIQYTKKLPDIEPSESISLEIENCQITCNKEEYGLHCYSWDGHEVFRIQYFAEEKGHHCINGYDVLTGNEKIESLNYYLNATDNAVNSLTEITFEIKK